MKTMTRPKIARVTMTEEPQKWTEWGWARVSLTPPREVDMLWIKMPEQHVYQWDGDGWYRISPPEPKFLPPGDLPHG